MVTFNSSWIPDEDPQTLLAEKCWIQGVIVATIAYGVTIALYFMSFYHLVHTKNQVTFNSRLLLLIFITVTFLLETYFIINTGTFTQLAFIEYRNFPGGPDAFVRAMFFIPMDDAGGVANILSIFLSDALMVWRFKVIFQMSQVPLWIVMFFPCLLLAGSGVIGIIFLIHFSTAGSYVMIMAHFGVPFLVLSLALNVILTIAIVLRLLMFRHRIVSLMGPNYGTRYISAAAIIIESAAMYSAISITYFVLLGIGNAAYGVFLASLLPLQTIATFLIVFRVAQGKGWTQNTAIHAMSGSDPSENIQFASPVTTVVLGISAGVTRSTEGELEGSSQISNKSPVSKEKEAV